MSLLLVEQQLLQLVGGAQQKGGTFSVTGDQLSNGRYLGSVEFVREEWRTSWRRGRSARSRVAGDGRWRRGWFGWKVHDVGGLLGLGLLLLLADERLLGDGDAGRG